MVKLSLYPYDKRVWFSFLFIKIYRLTYKNKDVPTSECFGLGDIDIAIARLNDAYSSGVMDHIDIRKRKYTLD